MKLRAPARIIHVLCEFVCADQRRREFGRLQLVASEPSPGKPTETNQLVREYCYGNGSQWKLVVFKKFSPLLAHFGHILAPRSPGRGPGLGPNGWSSRLVVRRGQQSQSSTRLGFGQGFVTACEFSRPAPRRARFKFSCLASRQTRHRLATSNLKLDLNLEKGRAGGMHGQDRCRTRRTRERGGRAGRPGRGKQ